MGFQLWQRNSVGAFLPSKARDTATLHVMTVLMESHPLVVAPHHAAARVSALIVAVSKTEGKACLLVRVTCLLVQGTARAEAKVPLLLFGTAVPGAKSCLQLRGTD